MDGRSNGVSSISRVCFRRPFSHHLIDEINLSCSGGGPVEIGSGVAGLAYSWVLGRRNERELLNFRPHNVSLVGLGSAYI
jgi:ammonia channel protein AmtB